MATITPESIRKYVEKHIPAFHEARLASLQRLKLKDILARKNPYLFKAKNLETPGVLIKGILDAHLSSQEETTFGSFLEDLAVFVCQQSFNGLKSSAEGIDLEFERRETHYFVSIKSGPNWGNSSQILKLRDNFRKAKKIYSQGKNSLHTQAVNGCCYGRQARKSEDHGDYLKLCGQGFWEFISGDSELYTKIIVPLGHQAKERNNAFLSKYEIACEAFTQEFRKDFCKPDTTIDWDALVRFNSKAKE